jgi:3-hydroxyacyl-CoA dehydrogenase
MSEQPTVADYIVRRLAREGITDCFGVAGDFALKVVQNGQITLKDCRVPEAIRQAMAFYAEIGKKPIRLHKELNGHVGNRLQAALYREVSYLISQGVLSVADADDAVSWGPGLRWGVMGPSLQWHLGGGAGGIKHFMEHLMDPLGGMWKTLGNPEVTPELKRTIVDGVLQEAGNRSVEQLAQEENELLVAMLRLRIRAANGVTSRTGEERLRVPTS